MGLIYNAVRLAISAILRNKTRSLLTVLGIMIGVAAVVTITALATAASDQVGGKIDSFASNAIYIDPQAAQTKGVKRASARVTDDDAKAIAREAVSVEAAAPFISSTGQVVYGDKNVSTYLVGTTLSYYKIRKFEVAHGANWTENDELLKTKVCVLGKTVANNLFGSQDPIGRIVRIGTFPYRVIGTLAEHGTTPFGDDQDDRVMMPIGSYRARIVKTTPGRADMLMASAREGANDRAIAQITQILKQRHHIPEDGEADFRVHSQAEMKAMTEGIAGVLSMLLLGVAAVSLVVGGVGVMNIMLVSVSERTREIGVRMSIGAREGDILVQFLVEAVVLSLVGGLLGAIFGIGAALGLGFVLDWNVVPKFGPLAIALATSGLIGVVFGFLPARRAATMDPIDALRTE
ncbi:MAG TPA: ABC transporter permease [Polyangiaceae bacterium]